MKNLPNPPKQLLIFTRKKTNKKLLNTPKAATQFTLTWE